MSTPAIEDYLKAIDAICQQSGQGEAGVARIASALDLTKGTVSAMIRRLADGGLVHAEPYGGVRLTAKGRKAACDVQRRHRLIELFLVKVVGLDWSEVHAEAERLEHAVSSRLIDRIDEMLGRPTHDPHGDPIPDAAGQSAVERLVPLSSCPSGERVVIGRIADQASEFLCFADRSGLRPGAVVLIESVDAMAGAVVLRPMGKPPVTVSLAVASKVLAVAS